VPLRTNRHAIPVINYSPVLHRALLLRTADILLHGLTAWSSV
jgi:hypothetical protein